MTHLSLNIDVDCKQKRITPKKQTQPLCAITLIKKNNTELHIFRYTTLYKILNLIYLKTYLKPLSNLSYYMEDDGLLLAEIKGTELFYIQDRIKAHINLLRNIKENSNLQYSDKPLNLIKDTNQLSLFEF